MDRSALTKQRMEVIVARAPRGRGFVVVQGYARLQTELDEKGFVHAMLQSSGEHVVLYRSLEGDLMPAATAA